MRSPLGQLLLQQKLVTPEQLEQALRKQATWGTRLGSNLVRLGALDLDTLARALSAQYGVPAAYERDFQAIQPTALARLPRRLVEKHLAVPLAIQYGKENRILSVALPDPNAVAVRDELAFAAGMRVIVNVAPELRLLNFLEAHFGANGAFTPMDLPYVSPDDEVPGLVHAPSSDPSTWIGEELPETLESALNEVSFSWRELLIDPGMPRSPPPVVDPGEDDVLEMLMEDVAEDAPSSALNTLLSPTDAMGRVSQAQGRDEVGDLLLRFLRGRFSCAVLFVVADGHARGWRGFRASRANEPMGDLSLPLNVTSCLRAAYDRRAPFHGPPPREGSTVHSQLWRFLSADAPRQVIVAPLVMGTRIAALVYGHTSEPIAGALPEELTRVCAAAATALVRLARRSI